MTKAMEGLLALTSRMKSMPEPSGSMRSQRTTSSSSDPAVQEMNRVAKLVFGMNQSLDGYVDHTAFAPSLTLFRHFVREAQEQAGSIYGREMYEVMRYWDEEHAEWNADERAFAA